MGLFQHQVGQQAILSEKGVERQVDIYLRNGILYGKVGSGYVKLMADQGTSKPTMRVLFVDWDGPLYRDKMGRLCVEGVADAKLLDTTSPLQLEAK